MFATVCLQFNAKLIEFDGESIFGDSLSAAIAISTLILSIMASFP
ncbi:hypothetical protein [Succinatimonas hippei]|nr:hypothetical protein [Succinatimonas hippei]MDM8120558.1 hypothetical protein [Succinatimonas hippei]